MLIHLQQHSGSLRFLQRHALHVALVTGHVSAGIVDVAVVAVVSIVAATPCTTRTAAVAASRGAMVMVMRLVFPVSIQRHVAGSRVGHHYWRHVSANQLRDA
jgi:hypothetical protein